MNLRLGIINRATYLYMLLEVESSAVSQQAILQIRLYFQSSLQYDSTFIMKLISLHTGIKAGADHNA